MSFLIIILLFVIAWVVLILPKQRELKRHNALLSQLQVGDDVMTGSGIYGTIVELDTDRVVVQIAPSVEVTFARRAIAATVPTPVESEVDTDTDHADDDEGDGVDGGSGQ